MIHSAKTLFREMFGELTAWGRFWLYLGLSTLVVAAAMSYSFGAEISTKHALFLMCLSAIAAFLPEAAYSQWEDGRKIVSIVLGVLALPILVIEFYTHAGYTAGLRGTNIETAAVQNMRFDGAQDDVKRNREELALLQKILAKLEADNPWATTAKADGLRAEYDALKDRMAKEENGKRGRKAGKGKEFEKLQDQANAVMAKIATIEKADETQKRIAVLQEAIDKKRTVANATEHKSSAVDHQNKFLAKTVALVADGSLKPSEIMTESAQQTVNLMMALAGTGLPALALFVAGLYRREGDKRQPKPARATTVDSANSAPAQSSPVVNLSRVTVGDINREKLRLLLDRSQPTALAA